MNLITFYTQLSEQHNDELSATKRTRNIVTTSKLICFGLFVWGVYIVTVSGFIPLVSVGILGIILFIALSIYDTKIVSKIRELKELIKCCHTEIEYINGNLASMPRGEKYMSTSHTYAQDLDIFGDESLFQALNRTVTALGSDMLADWLLNTCNSVTEIVQRQDSAREISSKIEWTHQFRALGAMYSVSKNEISKLFEWGAECYFFKNRHLKTQLITLNAITIISWIALIFSIIPPIIPILLFLLQLGITLIYMKKINRLNARLSEFIKSIGNYFQLIKCIENETFTSAKMATLKSNLSGSKQAFTKLNKIMNGFDQRNNILVAIVLNGLYIKDLHHVIALDVWREFHHEDIAKWIESVSEIDALISAANYKFNHPDFSVPIINNDVIVKSKEMRHPLLRSKTKVVNDFTVNNLHEIFVITGANMAGKSTFLRSVGVNIVLALSGNVVCASEFEVSIMTLFTSMRTTDNLAKGTSYFHAELIRLKQLIDAASSKERMFIILDEMLKGTNSQDKLNGSRRFLIRLLNLPVAGIVATHDLALGELSEKFPHNFHNNCFEIEHTDDDIVYDYILKEGVSKNMNASILLEKMGIV